MDYLHHRFIYADDELLHIVYLGKDGKILDREMTWGGRDRVGISLRSVVWRAIYNDAAGILIAHNHPSGKAEPSAADRDLTRRLAAVGRQLNMDVMDHLIYAGGDWFSFRAAGLL
jgi:DNA repair protein RadC